MAQRLIAPMARVIETSSETGCPIHSLTTFGPVARHQLTQGREEGHEQRHSSDQEQGYRHGRGSEEYSGWFGARKQAARDLQSALQSHGFELMKGDRKYHPHPSASGCPAAKLRKPNRRRTMQRGTELLPHPQAASAGGSFALRADLD